MKLRDQGSQFATFLVPEIMEYKMINAQVEIFYPEGTVIGSLLRMIDLTPGTDPVAKSYFNHIPLSGADILDGTPIYDIKPYLAYTDSHPDAVGGFADGVREYKIEVDFPTELVEKIDTGLVGELFTLLENDPRPSYKVGDEKEYGMRDAHYEIFFRVTENVLHVTRVTEV